MSGDLIWAVKNGDLDKVKELCEKDFDANAFVDGRAPAHFAADYGQLEVLAFLVSKVGTALSLSLSLSLSIFASLCRAPT